MLQHDITQYSKVLWVKFYKDKMQLISKNGEVQAVQIPELSYSHSRLVLANFKHAQLTLKQLMKHYSKPLFFLKSNAPIVLVQIMEPIQGGITEIERRAFTELFIDVIGLCEIKIYDLEGYCI